MSRSIYTKVFSAFLLLWLAVALAHWAARAISQESGIVFLILTLALTIVCATVFCGSISRRLKRLTLLSEAIARKEIPTHLPDFGDDEVGDFARSVRDMTPDLQRLAEGLAAALAQRDAILEGMIEALLVVDREMRVSFCNAALGRMLAPRGAPQPGEPVLNVIRDPALLKLMKAVIQTGRAANSRCEFSVAPGRAFHVWGTPVAGGAVVLLLDITEMERMERIRKDFIANVSHELRTPLAAIRGYAETLLDGALDDLENRRTFVETILAHSNRLNNIASDLLALSDLESGTPAANVPVSVEESIDTAMQTVQAEAAMRDVQLIRGDIAPGLKVRGNKMRLEQVLINLLDNAAKFNRSGGTVRIDAEVGGGDCAHISISDSGIGIPSDELSRIFERFYRVDKGRSRAVGGTGLGLSIVKHAIEQMNGSVTVESILGKGSCFKVSLPLDARLHNGSAHSV